LIVLQTAGMETDDLQAQLSQLQQLITDEENKRLRQKVPICYHIFSCQGLLIALRLCIVGGLLYNSTHPVYITVLNINQQPKYNCSLPPPGHFTAVQTPPVTSINTRQ